MGAPNFIFMKNVFRVVGRAALWLTVMAMIGESSLAQMETATLSGTVMDQSGAAVPDTQVQATNSDTNITVTTATNKAGIYVLPALKPGRYRVVVTKQGFKQVLLTDVILSVQDVVSRNFNLQVGAVSESISISADAPFINTESAAVRTVVDQRLMSELPLNGRSFQTLFELTPGVVIAPTNFSEQGQFSVNGQRTDANYFTVDGVSGNIGAPNGFGFGQFAGGALPAMTGTGGTNGLVSTEAVQEFAIQTSTYAPEFGRTPGAQISVVTRSGSNVFHGSAFDYFRNDALDATDWFADRAGLPKAKEHQNDFGGTLGGPLWKNKTFFFLSYEGLRLLQPSAGLSDVPTVASRKAAPSVMQPYLNAYPLPTGADEGNGLAPANYSFSNGNRLDAGSIRMDEHLGSALSIFGRYNYAPSEVLSRGGGISGVALNSVNNSSFSLQTATAGLTYAITPRIGDELRFNWSSSGAADVEHLDTLGGATPLTPGMLFPPSVDRHHAEFVMVFANANNSDLVVGTNNDNGERQWNLVNNLSWQWSDHLLKFGLDYRRLTPSLDGPRYEQVAEFSDVPSAISATAFTLLNSFAGPVQAALSNYSVYGQDTWKIFPRLSLTYGVRWDYNPPGEARGAFGLRSVALTNADNLSSLAFAPSGSSLYRATKDNFAPRFGLAYQLRNSGSFESVVRAGFGVFYDLGTNAVGNTLSFYPFSAQAVTFGSFPLSANEAAPPAFTNNPPFSQVVAFLPTIKQPYTYQWNFSYEQSLGAKQSVTVAYVGSAGHSLLRQEEFNSSPPLPSTFQEVELVTNRGYSNYNALQTSFQRRASNGLEVLGSYTLAHSLDNGSSDQAFNIPTQFVSPNTNYGPSNFDIRHTGTVAVEYKLPAPGCAHLCNVLFRGWGVNTFLTARSSPPVDVTVSRFLSIGFYSFRPNLLPGMPFYIDDSSAPGGRRFNPGAVVVPQAPIQGDLGRNAFRAFPLVQADASVRRDFHLTERIRLEGRVEAFNVLNHPNFSPPSGSLGFQFAPGQISRNPNFGISQSLLNTGLQDGFSGFNPLYQVGGPRSLQLALKLEF
jgi:hypothetical protein